MTARHHHTIYRFGRYRLNPAGRELRRGEDELSLPLKVFDCIAYLVENRERAVGRDELISAVWGKVDVSDSTLSQALLLARKNFQDSGDEQQYIKTVRNFGYRWVAPVEVLEPSAELPALRQRRGDTSRTLTKSGRGRMAALGLAIALLVAGLVYFTQQHESSDTAPLSLLPSAGEIALVLPVVLEDGLEGNDDHAWVRLGIMDLVAARLRAAGQSVVPADTTIALLGGNTSVLEHGHLEHMVAATGAHLVLEARARVTGARWNVALRSIYGTQPQLTVAGEAHDVIEAARIASDRMSVRLGLNLDGVAEDTGLDLQILLLQLESAKLSQQTELAIELIESADSSLRNHPEMQLQLARLAFQAYDLTLADETLQPIIQGTTNHGDRDLRAKALNLDAALNASRGNMDSAKANLEQAAQLFGPGETPELLGRIKMNLAMVALERGHLAAGREEMAQARRIFASTGHLLGLANLDLNLGVMEIRAERYPVAELYLDNAASRFNAAHDVNGELRARAFLMHLHTRKLDLPTARTLEAQVTRLADQTDNLELWAVGHLAIADLMYADGRLQAAEARLNEVLKPVRPGSLPELYRLLAMSYIASYALSRGDMARVSEIIRSLPEGAPHNTGWQQAQVQGELLLLRLRASLAEGETAAAADALSDLVEIASKAPGMGLTFLVELGKAELAAASGEHEAVLAAFEQALARAGRSSIPARLLQVTNSYIPWLLREDPLSEQNARRALSLADRLGPYTDLHYEVALLQLRVYHALGPPAAWRVAFDNARALAGEREIPRDFAAAP